MSNILVLYGRSRIPTRVRMTVLAIEAAFFPGLALVGWSLMREDFAVEALWIALALGALWWASGAWDTLWQWRKSKNVTVKVFSDRVEFSEADGGVATRFVRREVLSISVRGRADIFSMVNPGHVADGPLPRVTLRHTGGSWTSPPIHLWGSQSDKMACTLESWAAVRDDSRREREG